jgi:hypothetical protein
MFRIYLELNINPIKPSTALPNLVRLSLEALIVRFPIEG